MDESDCCHRAALGGHLEVLQWLREHDCPWCKSSCLVVARDMNYTETRAWVRAQPE